jgi:hypothetical protein
MKKNYFLTAGIAMLAIVSAVAQPTVPPNPAAGNSSNCTVLSSNNTPLDQCPNGSTTFVTNFQGGTYNRGNNGNNLGAGAIWRFANIGTISGTTINAEVTINSLFQAVVDNIDNNSALDQNNVSVADFFAPRIRPDVSLNNSDRRGYVQFTVNFFQGANNYTTAINIASLNFISYDADGSFESGGATSAAWFRETRVAQVYNPGNPTVLANNSSELVAYNYTDPAVTSWNGFAGGVYERTGLSRCAQVASSFRYSPTPRSFITFRFGYDFKAGTNGYNIGTPSREYGARFGCYTFPNQVTLPVTLLSFNGALKNNTTQLNWVAENQVNFDRYEIERSSNGTSFSSVGSKAPIQNNTSARENYQYSDDLTAATGNVFFYRLKMVDADGTFKYSSIIVIRKDQKSIVGITIIPNPIINGGMATVKFEATTRSTVEFKVVDMAGRVVLKQQNNVTEGINSIAITHLDRLQPGMYVLQMNDGSTVNVTKFTIAQ